MKVNIERLVAIVGIGLGLVVSANSATADSSLLNELSAEWWQWAVSIPAPVNPLLDTDGKNCMVGQRGSTWFLAGVFGGGGATRTCFIPENKVLYFPVVNQINFNTPNVCGQGSNNLLVADMRAASRAFVDGARNLLVKLDGKAIRDLQRVQSRVFEVALPEENVFDKPCSDAGLGSVPAGIYSPAVDDGFYVALQPLEIGTHTLQIQSKNPTQDVTYALMVVPVLLSN
jgi:hypothetical protein